MEVNGNLAVVPSDAINIIVEFAQPNAEEYEENRDIVNGDSVAVRVFEISSTVFKPAQSQPWAGTESENASHGSQRPSPCEVIKILERQQHTRKTLKASRSNSCLPSTTNLSALYQQLQPVARELQFQNNKVKDCQKETNQKGSDKEMTKVTPLESPVQESATEIKPGQITSSTKLALQTFLKKKAAGIVSGVSVGENTSKTEQAVQVASPGGEGGDSSHEDKLRSNLITSEDKDPSEAHVQPPVENLIEKETAKVHACLSESVTTAPVECAQESHASTKEVTTHSTDVQGEGPPSSAQQSDIPRRETGVAVTRATSPSVVQEVDVVMFPSHLEADNSKQMPKPQKKRKNKKTDPKEPKMKKYFSQDCVECGKHFKSKRAHSAHMNIHYDIRPFKCVECGKAFRQHSHLDKHKLLHTGEKPHVCQYCNKAFRCRYNRRDHERIHTGEKPCKCNTCGEMFRCTATLHNHYISAHKTDASSYGHARKRVFTCKVCRKTFSWSSALSVHKKIHNAVGTYKCLKCPKKFKCNSNLWNHLKTHSKEKPFECELCGQRLKRKGNLKRHVLTQHDPKEAEEYLKTSRMFAASNAKRSR